MFFLGIIIYILSFIHLIKSNYSHNNNNLDNFQINTNKLSPLHSSNEGPIEPNAVATTEQTRRILRGVEVHDTRPYMVYLRPAPSTETHQPPDPNWLCGGAIIHERYILTSAACIEDVKNFYVVSGTNKWLPMTETNDCIKNGAKKAVWKCVPKNYFYDGDEFDNIRWMSGDLAVVKVEDDFNFERRVKGCDFIPQKIPFNNRSAELERGGTVASTAGWGSTDKFGDKRSATVNTPILMETEVVLLSNKNCKKRWEPRYHTIIDESMICAKDGHLIEDTVCTEQEVDCKELVYSAEDDDDDDVQPTRRFMVDPKTLDVHSASHFNSNQSFRRYKVESGGFCENDHGGPLVHGQGKSAIVIGVISACLTKSVTKKCYGPFLFTSVFKYRNVITCAIDKDIYGKNTCRVLLRASKTHMKETNFDWDNHPDGSAKSELPRSKERNPFEKAENKASNMAQILNNLKFKNEEISQSMNPMHILRSQTQTQGHITPRRKRRRHTTKRSKTKSSDVRWPGFNL